MAMVTVSESAEREMLAQALPQADSLVRLADLVKAVAVGTPTRDLGYEIGASARQGRYYRRAAEQLTLVARDGEALVLTESGRRFVAHSGNWAAQMEIVRAACLRNAALSAVLEHVAESRTTDGLAEWLAKVAEISEVTAKRRLRSALNWLTETGLLPEAVEPVLQPVKIVA